MKPERKRSSPTFAQPSGRPVAATAAGRSMRADLTADGSEPTAGSAHVPIWLIVLFAVLFYWSQLYLDKNAGEFNAQVYEPFRSLAEVKNANPQSGPDLLIAKGRVLYQMCIGCHQETGLGGTSPEAPPLAGSDWVNAPLADRIIRIPLNGLAGPIKVGDKDFNLSMAALGSSLSNEDLAAILTYVRQAWGNKAGPVTPEQVAAVRQEIAGRPEDGTKPWSVEELLKIPDGR